MFLRYFKLDKPTLTIRPAKPQRDWMDATPLKFAYRCLPMTIAGSAGWELLNPVAFSAVWNGKRGMDAIRIDCREPHPIAVSHFGNGILTFRVGFFRSTKGVALWVGGSPNHIKDAIQPLTGIVETDWIPMSFTMNWRFTRKRQRVYFEQGEPICFIYPIDLSLIESVEPTIENIGSYPEIEGEYREWAQSREEFNQSLMEKKNGKYESRWQKFYFRGTKLDGSAADAEHRTRMAVRPFLDRTGKRKDAPEIETDE